MTITVTEPPHSPREMTAKYIQALYGQSMLEFAQQFERELLGIPAKPPRPYYNKVDNAHNVQGGCKT